MTTVSIQESQRNLSELIHKLVPGDEILIIEGDTPFARLTPAAPPPSRRKLGTMKGTVRCIAPDFDAPLEDFKEHVP